MNGENSNDVDQVLRTACAQTAFVKVLCVDSERVYKGRFKLLSRGLLSIDLLEKPAETDFKPLSQCVSIYRQENRVRAFLTLVKDVYEATTVGTLVVYEPHQLASERRSAVRVPIYEDHAPLVRVHSNGEDIWTAQAIDISLTGILVELASGEVPELSLDTHVRIELKFEETEVDLAGEVRRRDGHRYGILFSEVLKGQSIEPPDALVKLVRKLERIWLQRRAD